MNNEQVADMSEEQFDQLMGQAERGETLVVLGAVDIEPVLATRRTGKSRITLLHNASSNGHAALAVGLLDRKANVSALNTHGKDPRGKTDEVLTAVDL